MVFTRNTEGLGVSTPSPSELREELTTPGTPASWDRTWSRTGRWQKPFRDLRFDEEEESCCELIEEMELGKGHGRSCS